MPLYIIATDIIIIIVMHYKLFITKDSWIIQYSLAILIHCIIITMPKITVHSSFKHFVHTCLQKRIIINEPVSHIVLLHSYMNGY